MVARIVGSLVVIAAVSLASGMLFPPGDVVKQFMVAGLWFCAGISICKAWS